MVNGKILASGVSLILVVGVAIGVVVVVNRKGTSNPEVEAQQKSVKAMCEGTDDPKLCHDTLITVNSTNSSDPKAYIAAGVEATAKSVIQSPDLRNWLSAIISYQQSCMDGFNNETNGEQEIKEQLHTGSLDQMGKLTGIVLDIVTNLSKILQSFDLKLDLNPASRRLLELDAEGYPTWFSAADRRLLAKMNQGGAPPPNAVVALDGSGQFKSVKQAIDSYPKNFKGRFIIYVKAGVYNEYILIPKKSENIMIYGDGPTKTITVSYTHLTLPTTPYV